MSELFDYDGIGQLKAVLTLINEARFIIESIDGRIEYDDDGVEELVDEINDALEEVAAETRCI